ncbi:NAD(P)H-hydrate dehydratase [Hasllibacter sp. MH4015]|uniref:NAD(P)H-hydrate dehydratase n=1 Tax=Hasllibacter sp. MH4015 TaxID=2854029 RepID=UPI001CD76F81|nr:NAD(P)H-hydrate dehydratase [Hasllibacter sp. MH4015]
MRLLTAVEMRAIEHRAMDAGEVTGLELMERAGRGVVEATFAKWPELAKTPHRAVILCGPGNNGGDGYVIARLLRDWGWEVAVFGMGAPQAMPPDAAENRERWRQMGTIAPLEEADFEGADLIVDALFGTGLSRGFAPPDRIGAEFHALFADGFWGHGRDLPPRVVAVDIPSGLDADTGRVLAADSPWCGDVAAHLTVTFHRAKLGHVLADGPFHCGELAVVDIGLSDDGAGVALARAPDPVRAEPALGKGSGADHKFYHGHALILSGGIGRTGAARLAARAALRVGAGLVTLGAPGSAILECAAHSTAVMVRRCDGSEGLSSLLQDKRLNTLCLGPGLGQGAEVRDLVLAALGAGRSVVLDADGLSTFSDAPDALLAALHHKVVLTPHGGEFARIFPDIAARLNERATDGPAYSRLTAARDAADRAGCVVLLKGPDTIVAAPGGRAVIHAAAYDRAAPWLATAGSGDVLAGLITGLMARGFDPFEAAQTGAWLHTEAALAFGPGLIAEDLPEMLPKVFRDIGL